METNIATIKREENCASLILQVNSQSFEIILTEDNPNNIKGVFNKLLKELKKGLFNFKLEDENEDLYQNICKEYLIQLNAELINVYEELREYELLES